MRIGELAVGGGARRGQALLSPLKTGLNADLLTGSADAHSVPGQKGDTD